MSSEGLVSALIGAFRGFFLPRRLFVLAVASTVAAVCLLPGNGVKLGLRDFVRYDALAWLLVLILWGMFAVEAPQGWLRRRRSERERRRHIRETIEDPPRDQAEILWEAYRTRTVVRTSRLESGGPAEELSRHSLLVYCGDEPGLGSLEYRLRIPRNVIGIMDDIRRESPARRRSGRRPPADDE